ncbi:hypothetical protein LCGC14_2057300, partial [marine sediment metagenome]
FRADDDQAAEDVDAVYGETQVHHTVEAFAAATGLSIEMIEAHKITIYNSATGVPLHVLRLPWRERRALGVEFDKLYGLDGWETSEGRRDRLQEIEMLLAANPLDSYSSEEIDAYNIEHFGNAAGRPSVQEGA